MVVEKNLILDASQVKQKIRRMAYEIFEHNFKEKSIVIAGIEGQGYVLAQHLAKELESISPLKGKLVKVTLDKSAPQQSEVTLDCEYLGRGTDPWGKTRAGFSFRTELDRREWGLKWNQALETGGVLVANKVRIEGEVQFVRQGE